MTPILQVITEYCAIYVKDINLENEMKTDMPLYARKMWAYLQAGIPLFTIPRNMQLYLLGTETSPNITLPQFTSTLVTITAPITTTTTYPLGSNYKNYDLFCCRQQNTDSFGNIYYTPAPNVTYDPATGNLTITGSETNPVAEGTIYDIDFYTDGYFIHTLTSEEMMILGLCFAVVWQTRFNNDWLSNIPKIEDKSFSEQNRANKMNADTARLKQLRENLAAQMRSYEQNKAYNKVFPMGNGLF